MNHIDTIANNLQTSEKFEKERIANEKYVIMRDVMGDTLDVPVKVTESQIQCMQELYIRNLVRVCEALGVAKITPMTLKVQDRWTHNPYIDYKEDDMFYKLGKSCVEDGMQWLLIIKDGAIFEGVHRIMALQELVKRGDYKDEELEFPALDISNPKFNKPVEIEFFKFRSRFQKMKRYGMYTRSLWYNDILNATGNFMSQSAMMKYIYFEWKKKYKKEYPQPECINNYDKLMEKINEYKNKGCKFK